MEIVLSLWRVTGEPFIELMAASSLLSTTLGPCSLLDGDGESEWERKIKGIRTLLFCAQSENELTKDTQKTLSLKGVQPPISAPQIIT